MDNVDMHKYLQRVLQVADFLDGLSKNKTLGQEVRENVDTWAHYLRKDIKEFFPEYVKTLDKQP